MRSMHVHVDTSRVRRDTLFIAGEFGHTSGGTVWQDYESVTMSFTHTPQSCAIALARTFDLLYSTCKSRVF